MERASERCSSDDLSHAPRGHARHAAHPLPPNPKHLEQTKNFVGPEGGTAYLMQCFDGIGCYERAREACAKGYTIFDSIDSTNGSITTGTGFVGSSHYIAFECKP
jgi:hypothetical protein